MGSCLILVEMLIPSIRLDDDLNVKSLQIPIALILLEGFPKAIRLRGVTGFNKKNPPKYRFTGYSRRYDSRIVSILELL